jgi:SAM-dependent methyltransferase
MTGMDAREWDARYAAAAAAADTVWSVTPNATIGTLTETLPAGRALDIASGEGRNAIWLAERGWQATALDFSEVATARARELAAARLGASATRFEAIAADVLGWPGWEAARAAYDLVLVVFLHLPAPQRRIVHRYAAAALAPGGRLIVLAHDRSNLTDGVGGPQDPTLLPTPDEVVADLDDTGLRIERAEVIDRVVPVPDSAAGPDAAEPRVARDCLVVAIRSA